MCIYVCILKGLGGYIHVHVCVYIEGSGWVCVYIEGSGCVYMCVY